MIGITGFSKRFFEALSEHNINVIVLSFLGALICIGVKEDKALKAKDD